MEDRDEQQHLHALVELLEHGRQFEDLTTADPSAGPWKPAAGSDLEDDDVAVAPYHLSHAAWLALTVAGDHLRALRTSVLTEESADRVTAALHTHAQASLARGVIENAARAVWLLASGFVGECHLRSQPEEQPDTMAPPVPLQAVGRLAAGDSDMGIRESAFPSSTQRGPALLRPDQSPGAGASFRPWARIGRSASAASHTVQAAVPGRASASSARVVPNGCAYKPPDVGYTWVFE